MARAAVFWAAGKVRSNAFPALARLSGRWQRVRLAGEFGWIKVSEVVVAAVMPESAGCAAAAGDPHAGDAADQERKLIRVGDKVFRDFDFAVMLAEGRAHQFKHGGWAIAIDFIPAESSAAAVEIEHETGVAFNFSAMAADI